MPRLFLACLLVLVAASPLAAQSAAVREARLRLAADDPAGAVEKLAGTPDATDPEGAFTLALALQQLARHASADSAFARADTSQSRVLAAWARSLESLGRERKAVQVLAHAYHTDSTAAPIGLAYARLLAAQNDWRGARRVYTGLLALDSTNAYLHARLGYVAYQLKEDLDAIVHYEKALQLNPQDKGALLALTRVYLENDAPLSAKRSIERLLARHLEEPDVWVRRGEIGVALEEYPSAIGAYRAAMALGDTTAPTLRALGASYYLAERYPDADTVLTRAFRSDDTHALTAYYLAMTRFALEDYDSALQLLQQTTTLMEQGLLAEVHAQRGAVYKAQNDDSKAIAAYRLARLLDEGKPEFLYHLATLYDRYYRDPSAAREAFEAFIRLSADAEALADQRAYAEERLRQMREQAHMQGER